MDDTFLLTAMKMWTRKKLDLDFVWNTIVNENRRIYSAHYKLTSCETLKDLRAPFKLSWIDEIVSFIVPETEISTNSIFYYQFLPCDALRCTVLVIVILSIRPSVTPHGSTVRPTIMISPPYGSPMSFGRYHVHPKIRMGSPRVRALN